MDIEAITINALAILGLWAAAGEGMLLHRPASAIQRLLGPALSKPFIGCPACMASVWAFVPAFWIIFHHMDASPQGAAMVALSHACATSALTQILLAGWNALDRAGREGGEE